MTASWQTGDSIVDKHGLLIPSDLPAGDYTLIAGLYDISDAAARLAVEGSSSVELGTVTVQ